ncbi:MAG: glycosyl transferase family 2 [Planctomycetaceae bacterium]
MSSLLNDNIQAAQGEKHREEIPLSLIVPVGPGESCWRRLLDQIETWSISPEVILVHAETAPQYSHNDEAHSVHRLGERFRKVVSPAGRAKQMNAGADAATQPLLWFVHADSQLTDEAAVAMYQAVKGEPRTIHFLRLLFDSNGPRGVRINAWGTWFRSRVLGLPFGDQGLGMSRELFQQLGCYDTTARFGEDHLLVWRAHQCGVPVRQANGSIVTSARKYRDRGWLRTTFQHLMGTLRQALPQWVKLWRGRLGLETRESFNATDRS